MEMVIANLQKNVATSKDLLRRVIPTLGGQRECPCESALRDAIITPKEDIPEDLKRKLAPVTGRYLS